MIVSPPKAWRALQRTLDDASIVAKLLITPFLAILALALVCGLAWSGFNAETQANEALATLSRTRLRETAEAKMQAATLQADMFRFTTMGLMGLPRDRLEQLGSDITTREQALAITIASLEARAADPAQRAGLERAMADYRTQASHAVANLLGNIGWGAVGARNAAVALDAVIAAVDLQQRQAVAEVARALQAQTRLNTLQKSRMLAVLVIGSPLMIIASLLTARRIAGPVRKLTAVMIRLAGRHYDGDIPASGRRDEVGAMASAVHVFREGLMRADALALQQQATQNFLDSVLENVPAPILVKRAADLRYIFVNRAAEQFIGAPRQSLLGRTTRELLPTQADAIDGADAAALALGGKVLISAVTLDTLGNGQRLTTMTRLAIAGADGTPEHLLVMIDDITERQRAEQRIAYMAHFDSLTGLPNRVLFADRLAEALMAALAARERIAVLGLDLDHFKEVNDTLGHAAGDLLLRQVAARLGACLRQGDTLARLGGDEFAVIQCGVGHSIDADALAERLIDSAREPFDLDGNMAFIGLSAGIAFSTPGIDPGELVKRADFALYEAKRSGRSCFRRFVPDMTAGLQQRRTLDHDLRAALERDQFQVQYQPQLDLGNAAIVGAEAVLRWRCPQRGDVPPGIFIPIAEETGVIGPLGEWLLLTACRTAALWPAPMRVMVDVSPLQLRLPGFTGVVRSALAGAGLDPGRLEVKLTEGILRQDAGSHADALQALRALGVQLVLDYSDTGHTSLGALRRLHFDKIRIARSFVSGACHDQAASAIVGAVAGLARTLGTLVVADGVETEADALLLRSLGCSQGQGAFFFPPLDADALLALTRTQEPAPRQRAPTLAS